MNYLLVHPFKILGFPLLVVTLCSFETSSAFAEESSAEMDTTGVATLNESRDGSGTSWMPDATPMYGFHQMLGDWRLMYHANLFLQSIHESSPRADDQIGSINWVMVMADTSVGSGNSSLRLMMSAENWTVGKCGYLDLLQTGEVSNGKALHDQQHPHDLFMEMAATYKLPLSHDLGLEIYGGLVGEPALGPTAFPHRLSAFPGPKGPVSHHWLDSTHISFGVATVGLYTTQWRSEVSAFNGREPDDNRTDFDLGTMDSYSGRISYLPTAEWALQISGGRLTDAEKSDNGRYFDVERYTASAIYHHRLEDGGIWASTAAYGANVEHGSQAPASLLETSLNRDEKHVYSARFETVKKSGHDLAFMNPVHESRSRRTDFYAHKTHDWLPLSILSFA
ncbi:MAG: hypothetical protein H7249_08350 [Chitinophagaceae bacterium]|nr:hypothetical protein [Oligoflexus sp.]